MTKEMYEELARDLKRKNKWLLAIVIVLTVLFIGMSVFAFSEFSIVIENKTEYVAEQNAETQGDNSQIKQNIDLSKENNPIYFICGCVILGVLIITVGVVLIYGKITSKNHNKKTGKGDDY